MTSRETSQRSGSAREREHAEMLKAARAQPGVREVMEVYRGWQETDRGLDVYRLVTRATERTTTSNSTKAL